VIEDLSGRVAVVTGGAGGIGRAMGERFAREGMQVVLADVEPDALDQAVDSLRSSDSATRHSSSTAPCTWCATTPA
jgi:NAD(P)-dependent dehydrogenase (short-subunit alcohol dehydrogenase family)